MSNVIEKVKSTIASTFEIPIETVRDDSSSQTIKKWDSIGQINLVMALEQDLGLSFTMDEIMQLKDVATICRVAAAKTAEAKAA